LGQNFLVHENSAKKIANWANVKPGDQVLEIGPGLGAMTKVLGKLGASVIAIEVDKRLHEHLKIEWVGADWLQLIRADALDFDLRKLKIHAPMKVVSNLPYSISTPLLEVLMKSRDLFSGFFLLLQKEVVDRIVATPNSKEYGRLSIWIQSTCDVEKGPVVSKGSFEPKPDVDSRLVHITPSQTPLVPKDHEKEFLDMVAKIFQHRRKTLKNTLRDAQFSEDLILRALARTGIDPGQRPQTVTIPELYELRKALSDESVMAILSSRR
jgi:16S rRNA (adenine1518-N6/adenine1519-N6)-dimethyltransferase